MLDINNIVSSIDLKLNLLSGDALYAEGLEVKPLTIRQINNLTYSMYGKCLNILTLDKKDMLEGSNGVSDDKSLLEIVILSKESVLIEAFAEAVCLFMNEKRDNLLVTNNGFLFGTFNEARLVGGNNYDDFVKIIKYQNCMVSIGSSESVKSNPADDKAQAILSKMKKAKEKVDKKVENTDKDQSMDFADIVSAVSTRSNTYNKHTVWDLTVYQLYDEYKRLEAISNYNINIKAMLKGAKIDNLKHWSARLD